MQDSFLVLPRPGEASQSPQKSISAPSEESFISKFGALLPPAKYLKTDHGKAAYYEIKPENLTEKPLVKVSRVFIVHGVQTPALGMQPLVSVLKERFPNTHFVLLDLWGHGLSDTPILPHGTSLFHSLVEGVLLDVGWEDAHFIGYSFGGAIVSSFAAGYRERVSSLVLIAPAGLMRMGDFDERQSGLMEGGEGVERTASEFVFEFLEGGKLVVPGDWEERVKRGEVVAEAIRDWEVKEHEGHRASVVGIFRDGGVFDRHAGFVEVVRLGIPCFSILGENDDVCSVQDLDGVGMRDVAVVEGAGHAVVRQRVPEVVELIEGFWNKL